MQNEGFCWHVHHDKLIEWCHDFRARVAFVKAHKPPRERALRLQLMRFVQEPLPVKLQALYQDAKLARHDWLYGSARDSAALWEAWTGAVKAATATLRRYAKERHALECPDCPWNGRTIFPRKKRT